MNIIPFFSLVAVFLLIFTTLASANVSTTTMTWFVATNKSISVTYGSPCSSSAFFFIESTAQFDSDADNNWAKNVPQAGRTTADSNCQTSAQAGMTVTNNGNTTENVDANFAATFTGADVNLVLKVWQGSSGCGTQGMGGWEGPSCSVVTVTSAPGTTTCREFSSTTTNAVTLGQRVITNLASAATQELCFSGDLNNSGLGTVAGGDHNQSYRMSSDYS